VATAAIGRDAADVVVLYRDGRATVDDPAFRAAVTGALDRLPRDKVTSITTYWSAHAPQLVSTDRTATYAVLRLPGADDKARRTAFDAIAPALPVPGLTVQVGGQVPTQKAINGQVAKDIGMAEGMSMPVLLVLLVLIFGSLVAASLPLALGALAILGSFTALHALTYVTDVSLYSINITTILGLGLAIDYGLFMVVRFRDELARRPVQEALARTMATAGRTVAVSGITVAIALSSMVLFPETFLRSMGYGGVATVLVDMLVSLTVLPALLAVLGTRVNRLSIAPLLSRLRRRRADSGESGFWDRLARGVLRRPLVCAVAVLTVLVVLALPFLRIEWGGIDARMMPAGAPERQVAEALTNEFPRNSTTPVNVVVTLPGPAVGQAGQATLASYSARLGAVPGVSGTQVTGVGGDTARISLTYRPDALSAQARALVRHVRAVPKPSGATVRVGGVSAQLVDELASLGSVLPWMALVMASSTFFLLFLAFGSVVLPVKAIVMNLLSLSATFGVVVWIFQFGHLHGLLGFTPTGTIEPSMPILMLAILFGLSMDYEVFLLSRIREQYDLTGDTREAIAEGLRRTGSIITSAALLLIIVIGSFSTSGITFIKLVGVGMFVAIVVDATVIRAVLVPATMRLLGGANWWAPGPLGRLYARYGITEQELPEQGSPEQEPSDGSAGTPASQTATAGSS
jgi:RND superfamily putative drug exporter